MQYASKLQIEKVVRESDNRLRLVVIASGLTSLDSSNRSPVNRSRAVRYQKAKSFYQQVTSDCVLFYERCIIPFDACR